MTTETTNLNPGARGWVMTTESPSPTLKPGIKG